MINELLDDESNAVSHFNLFYYYYYYYRKSGIKMYAPITLYREDFCA